MMLEAPPPRRQVSSAPVSLSAASAVLEKYLQNSETYAHLHPDALITPDGVTFNAKGGAMGNLLMHHLRRVAAGLRGEYLEPDTTLEARDEALDAVADGEGSKNTGAEQEWQDMAAYQAEQGGIEIGDVGNRTNAVQEGGQQPSVQTKDTKKRKKDQAHDHDQDQQPLPDGQVDKEARKKAKKERDLQRKRDNAAKAKKSD